jgi:hypothetical protein
MGVHLRSIVMASPIALRAIRRLALAILFAVLFAGCGQSGGAGLAPVRGKVVANGQPVTGGSLLFAPADGNIAQPATGAVNPDGTFVLGTTDTDDGAAVGRHLVTYNAPPRTGQEDWDGYGTPPPEVVSPFEGFLPKPAEVEVKSGQNDLTIELVAGN